MRGVEVFGVKTERLSMHAFTLAICRLPVQGVGLLGLSGFGVSKSMLQKSYIPLFSLALIDSNRSFLPTLLQLLVVACAAYGLFWDFWFRVSGPLRV